MTAQIDAVGPIPTIGELFVGSLMYGTVDEVRSVLRFVTRDDLDEPAATVLDAVCTLALAGTPPSPQLVAANLKRRGKLTRSTSLWLNAATTSGASSVAARAYADAVVAEAFRSKVESLGNALCSVADSASEAEINTLMERTVADIRGIATRLADLRGEDT